MRTDIIGLRNRLTSIPAKTYYHAMLDYTLIASEKHSALLREILPGSGCRENGDADLYIVERGYPVPEKGLSLVFDPEEPVRLIRFLNDMAGQRQNPLVLIGRKHETYEPLHLDEILFFQAAGNTLFAHTPKQAYEMKQKLYEIEKLISRTNFIRVNRSNIVNILKIKEIVPWFGGRLLLRFNGSEERIEVTRNFVKDFKQFLDM